MKTTHIPKWVRILSALSALATIGGFMGVIAGSMIGGTFFILGLIGFIAGRITRSFYD